MSATICPATFTAASPNIPSPPTGSGLTATPERSDGRHEDLEKLLGTVVYRRTAEELSGTALAPYQIVQLKVQLSEEERDRYTHSPTAAQ